MVAVETWECQTKQDGVLELARDSLPLHSMKTKRISRTERAPFYSGAGSGKAHQKSEKLVGICFAWQQKGSNSSFIICTPY